MDIRFKSWNEVIYKEEIDSRGNVRFGKSSYKNKQFVNPLVKKSDGYLEPLTESKVSGQPTPKYISNTTEVVYKAKWVVNTEYMYDYGLMENQSRKKSSWCNTDLDIQLYAWNFYKMQMTGVTERLIPLEDRACMAWFNLQNMSNKLIPYLINIDMNAVEAVNFGGGGGKAKPSEIIDFIFSNFVVPYRSTDLLNHNPNYKPVSIEATGQLAVFGQLYEELGNAIDMMRQVSGLNELTDGSTPNAKTLVPVANAAMESTNNALYLISRADSFLMKRLADSIIMKVQIAVKLGKVSGYAKALGSNTIKFFEINPNISLYELGIFIEDAPTEMQREMLWQEVNAKESAGLLNIDDKILVMTCRNLKQAQMILAYKINKRQEQQAQEKQMLVQQQTQGNAQVVQIGEQAKQQTINAQLQADLQRINAEKQWDFMIEQMKKASDKEEAGIQAQAKTLAAQIQANAKISTSKPMGTFN